MRSIAIPPTEGIFSTAEWVGIADADRNESRRDTVGEVTADGNRYSGDKRINTHLYR